MPKNASACVPACSAVENRCRGNEAKLTYFPRDASQFDPLRSLRKEVLSERRRASAAQQDAEDDYRRRSLENGNQDDEVAALNRKVALASSEIAALRVHTADLRRQIQSGCWPPLVPGGSSGDRGTDVSGGASGGEAVFRNVGDPDACVVAATMKEIVAFGGGGSGGGGVGGANAGASLEVARLASLLTERTAQVGVLTSTVEALQATTAFSSSPRKSGGIVLGPGNGGDRGGRDSKRAAAGGAVVGGSWAEVAPDVDGGVGILSHIGAQGLARHCVGLAVRLTSTTARAGAAERRADRLASDMECGERGVRAAEAAAAQLSKRCRGLEKGFQKSAAALSAVRAESAARLEEAGEEASKLR